MMKATRYFRFLMLLVAVLTATVSCTQNNGDIGDWFGEWKLASIEIDGEEDEAYTGDVLWRFQNNIVEMVVVNPVGHSHDEHYGTWSSDDKELTLNFTHSDNLNAAGTGKYAPPAQTYLPSDIVSLKVLKLSSREILLEYRPAPGKSIIYTLRKRG